MAPMASDAVQLYEYAVICAEKRDRDGEIVEEAEIVAGPETIIAKSDNQAQMLASRAIPEEYTKDGKLDRLTVVVRPF